MTGPEQHAATVRDGERIAAELWAAAEKGGVTWSQLACEQMSRTVRRLVALAGRADESNPWRKAHDEIATARVAAEARADELQRERDALQAILTTRTFATTESGANLIEELQRERDELRRANNWLANEVEQARREADQLRAVADAGRVHHFHAYRLGAWLWVKLMQRRERSGGTRNTEEGA